MSQRIGDIQLESLLPGSPRQERTRALCLTCSLLVFLVTLGSAVLADETVPLLTPKHYLCYRTLEPIRIDGRLDDAAWRAAEWTDPFVDIEGDIKPRPRFQTRVKMLWDERYFYIAAEMEEPHVSGTLTAHDSVIFHDNDFEVFIDPNGDNHEYYEFEINALNTGWDLFLPRPYKDGGKALDSWEIPGLLTAVHVDGTLNDPRDTDRGWSVELAFPWKVLGEQAYMSAPPKEGDQWRVNFSRVEWQYEIVDGKYRKKPNTKEDNWVWSPQGVVNMHRPETWGYVQFSTQRPGTVGFNADRAVPARYLLHRIYYAQQAYRKDRQRWAKTLEELDLKDFRHPSLAGPPQLWVGDGVFEASIEVRNHDGPPERWRIRQDSRIWKDTPAPRDRPQ